MLPFLRTISCADFGISLEDAGFCQLWDSVLVMLRLISHKHPFKFEKDVNAQELRNTHQQHNNTH